MADQPLRFGIVLFPGFQALDAFGPLDCINNLSQTQNITLSILSSTLDPVSTKPPTPDPNAVGQSIVPTHTFASAPPLDVLLIPGGRGTRVSSPHMDATLTYIKDTYPNLKYLITVCTGSGLLAKTGLLDGRRATTNKASWNDITAWGPRVNWVARARWVVDGKIWTSSGVSAGIDVTLAWIAEVFGEDIAGDVARMMEYTRHTDADYDPFAEVFGLSTV